MGPWKWKWKWTGLDMDMDMDMDMEMEMEMEWKWKWYRYRYRYRYRYQARHGWLGIPRRGAFFRKKGVPFFRKGTFPEMVVFCQNLTIF